MEAADIIRARAVEQAELSIAAAVEHKEALVVGFYEKLDQLVQAIIRNNFEGCIVYEWGYEEYVGLELYTRSHSESRSIGGVPLHLVIDVENNYEVIADPRTSSDSSLKQMNNEGMPNAISGDVYDPWTAVNLYASYWSDQFEDNIIRLNELLSNYTALENGEPRWFRVN